MSEPNSEKLGRVEYISLRKKMVTTINDLREKFGNNCEISQEGDNISIKFKRSNGEVKTWGCSIQVGPDALTDIVEASVRFPDDDFDTALTKLKIEKEKEEREKKKERGD